jgi:hypothetical protein
MRQIAQLFNQSHVPVQRIFPELTAFSPQWESLANSNPRGSMTLGKAR